MKVEINRWNGRSGQLSLKIVAETSADRVVLREFTSPMGGKADGTVTVYVDHSPQNGECCGQLDLGPTSIGLSIPSTDGG